MYGNPPLWPNIPSGEGGWSEWSGRFPNASQNEESEDQSIEENFARNAFLLIYAILRKTFSYTYPDLCLKRKW